MIRRQFFAGALLGFGLLAESAQADGDLVSFDVFTRKYHGFKCIYVRNCRTSCLTMEREAAIKRGGVPCKLCGGG